MNVENHKIKIKEGFCLSFLIFTLFLGACTANTNPDNSPVPTLLPTTKVTKQPSPEPTKTENRSEDSLISLVQAKVRERGHYDESVRVEVDREPLSVPLPGLSFFSATPMVVDSLDDNCAVYHEEVWCFQEALQNIIKQFSLGANPEQLSNEEWFALITFFTTAPISASEDLGMDAKSIPESELAKIGEPVITRPESGGIEISFYFKAEDMMGFGDLSLNILDFSATEDNEMFLEYRELWNNFDREE